MLQCALLDPDRDAPATRCNPKIRPIQPTFRNQRRSTALLCQVVLPPRSHSHPHVIFFLENSP